MEKRTTIGSSDIPAILGLSEYRTPLDVFNDLVYGKASHETGVTRRGHLLEGAILDEYERVNGCEVSRNKDKEKYGIKVIHNKFLYMTASLDGIVYGKDPHDSRVVEAKSTTKKDLWGEYGTDDVPDFVNVQVQHQLACSGFMVADIPVFFIGYNGSIEYKQYIVKRDDELIEDIEHFVKDFWENCVVAKVPPELSDGDTVDKLWRKSKPASYAEATREIMQRISDLKLIKIKLKTIQDEEAYCVEQIKRHMQDAEELRFDGGVVASWKTSKPSKRLDVNRLKYELPDVYAKYAISGEASRRFLIR